MERVIKLADLKGNRVRVFVIVSKLTVDLLAHDLAVQIVRTTASGIAVSMKNTV